MTADDPATALSITVPTGFRHLQLLRMQNHVTYSENAEIHYHVVNEKQVA